MAKENNLQSFRIGTSYVNLAVGIIVVIAVAALIVGLIRNGKIQKPGQTPEEKASMQEATNLPTKHTVSEGEDLWKISEKYYKTGYNWTDIATENNLTDPNAIEVGMELTIPNVAARSQEQTMAETQPTIVPTEIPQTSPPAMQEESSLSPAPSQTEGAISGDSYTVVKGDDLWDISVRAYGDGYKWIDIARANKLANPDLIHPGNVFTLPR